MWLFLAGLFAYFLIILLFIVSPKSTINSVSAFGLTWTNNNMANYMVFYHIFGCLWGWGVITGFNQVSIAGAIASYYWTLNKRNMPRFPLFQAVVRTLLYHMGSICIGAMLLAIVQFLRVLLRVFQWHAKGLKKIPGSKWIFCCIDCCLKCLTSIVKWMNKNAYIIMALEGTAFCKSASTAFGLLTRNAFKLLAIDFISTFVLFLGKVSVSAAVFFGTWAIMRSQSSVLNLNFTFVPAIVVALGSYVVATVFFGVYSMAIDTIFMSYLEDTERNDGSEDRPYYMSEALQKLTNIKNSKVVPVKCREMGGGRGMGWEGRKAHTNRFFL